MDVDRLSQEVKELRKVLAMHPALFQRFYEEDCVRALKRTVLFQNWPEELLQELSKGAERLEFPQGSFLVRQGMEADDAVIIADGELRRWAHLEGRKQAVVTYDPFTVGTLHIFNKHNSRLNAECVTHVTAYRIKKDKILSLSEQHPVAARAMIQGLTEYIHASNQSFRTPLFEQQGQRSSYTATSLAAATESFYRSGMNALINERITGVKAASYFPKMHIQVPTRVIYINGIKQLRTFGQAHIDFSSLQYPTLGRLLWSFVPGVVMCPFSSLLEASNMENGDPMHRRWTRGYAPRICREVIFGIGINQLSDYCTERLSFVENKHLQGAAGSITAGLIAGYLSHVPHAMSTKKLNDPSKSYRQLWQDYYKPYLKNAPQGISEPWKHRWAQVLSVAFPTGVVRRSLQIGGTFIIINGTIFVCRNQDWY